MSEETFLTEAARNAGYETGFGIPVPWINRPGIRVMEFLLRGSLPPRARELYRLEWSRADQAAFEAIALALRRSRPIAPRFVRRGSCEFLFDMVAGAERRRIRSGRPSAGFN